MNYSNIGPEEFKSLTAQEDAVILDVRSPSEKSEGVISGYQQINFFGDFADRLSDLDKEKTYLVYCRSGNRSGSACGLMANKGFAKLYNLMGGINAWNAKFGKTVE